MASMYFCFKYDVVNTGKPEPVYLHLEFENYQPDLMCSEAGMKANELWRMCPPGKCKFFFTVEGKARISNKYPTVNEKLRKKIKLPDEVYSLVEVDIDQINVLQIKPNPNIVKETYEISIQNCVPRPLSGEFYRAKAKKKRRPWPFPESLFRDYVPDTEVRFLILL